MSEPITAFYDGIEVMVLPESSFLSHNEKPIAAIEKIDDSTPDGMPVPKHVPFDNLSFPNGEKCKKVKFLKNLLLKKRQKKRKKKTIKKPLATH